MRTIGGGDYRRYCAALDLTPDEALTPAARAAALPAWISDPLIATAAATDKLRAWARRTARAAWSESGDPATVLLALRAYGDPVMPHEIARVLSRLPAPVRTYVVDAVTFLCVGRCFAGWCGARPAFETPWLIVLSARDELENLIAHEVGHSWLLEEPAEGARMMPAFVHQTIYETAIAKVPRAALSVIESARADMARDERQVAALLDAWGFANAF